MEKSSSLFQRRHVLFICITFLIRGMQERYNRGSRRFLNSVAGGPSPSHPQYWTAREGRDLQEQPARHAMAKNRLSFIVCHFFYFSILWGHTLCQFLVMSFHVTALKGEKKITNELWKLSMIKVFHQDVTPCDDTVRHRKCKNLDWTLKTVLEGIPLWQA